MRLEQVGAVAVPNVFYLRQNPYRAVIWPVDKMELIALLEGRRTAPLVVCNIEPRLAEVLQSSTREVWLSPATVRKQLAEHPELTIEEYLRLPHLVGRGLAYPSREGQIRLTLHAQRPERGLQTVIKRTKAGHEIYVVSFHFLHIRRIEALSEKPIIIRGPF